MLISPFRLKKSWPLLALSVCVFLGLYIGYGIVYANDSYTYLVGSVRVSPLYPLLIALLRAVFPEALYLHALVLLQELLAAYAVFSLLSYIGKRFSLHPAALTILLLAFIGSYFLRLFMVDEAALYCNAILTEGLTYPLYFLFVKYAFMAWDSRNLRYLFTAFLLAFLLAGVRGQLICLFLVVAILFLAIVKKSEAPLPVRRRVWFCAGALGIVYFVALALISAAYNYAISGAASQTTMGKETVFGAVLYNCDAEDAALFAAGSPEQAILTETLSAGEAEALTYKGAPSDFIGRFKHYEASHDELRDILRAAVIKVDRRGYQTDDEQRLAMTSHIDRMLPALLWNNLGRYLRNCTVNCFGGLVRSNSIMRAMGVVLSAFVYAFCLVFLLLSGKRPSLDGEKRFLLLVLMCTLINAMFCSFGVFELSRYVYYNFPCIYLALALYMSALLPVRVERRMRT